MYNTSRRDHFLSLKPLKMAPYFFKPIDIWSKSVLVGTENTFLSHLKTTVVLTGFRHARQLPDTQIFCSWRELLNDFMTDNCDFQTASTWLWDPLAPQSPKSLS